VKTPLLRVVFSSGEDLWLTLGPEPLAYGGRAATSTRSSGLSDSVAVVLGSSLGQR